MENKTLYVILFVGVTTFLISVVHYCSSISNAIQASTNSRDQLKVDQANLLLYESIISAHANTLIVDYPPSKNFVVFTSILYKSDNDED